jgi:tetratricopeptide (TPR) repeat protein
MADGLLWTSFTASLGTSFEYDRRRDTVLIVADDGTAVEVPAPDLREYLDLLHEATPGFDYQQVFQRANEGVAETGVRLERDRLNAPALLTDLLSLPAEMRRFSVREQRRFHNYFLATLVLERSRSAVHHDPQSSRDLADAARTIAECLPVKTFGEATVFSLRGYAEAVYANALRLLGELRRAALAFHSAHGYLESVHEPTLEAIEVLNLEVSLKRDLHDYESALELSDRAIQGFLEAGEMGSAAKAMLKRATVFELMDEQEQNIATLKDAMKIIDIDDEPWIALMVRQSLLFGLAREGRYEESESIRKGTLELYDQFPVPSILARRAWADGLLHEGWGDLEAAARALDRARETFTSHGYPMDAAVVSLDLAAVLNSLGRYREVRAVTAASYTLLESQGVHPDALAALAQFQQAAAQETLTRELIRQVARRVAVSPPQRSKPS